MDSEELMGRVRALRAKGSSPKAIARALGLQPAAVAPLVRAIAAEDQADDAEREVVECWVSVCGYLVDAYCLGVKDFVGPRVMDGRRVSEFSRSFSGAYRAWPPAVP